jgi:hypothetical protein
MILEDDDAYLDIVNLNILIIKLKNHFFLRLIIK